MARQQELFFPPSVSLWVELHHDRVEPVRASPRGLGLGLQLIHWISRLRRGTAWSWAEYGCLDPIPRDSDFLGLGWGSDLGGLTTAPSLPSSHSDV